MTITFRCRLCGEERTEPCCHIRHHLVHDCVCEQCKVLLENPSSPPPPPPLRSVRNDIRPSVEPSPEQAVKLAPWVIAGSAMAGALFAQLLIWLATG